MAELVRKVRTKSGKYWVPSVPLAELRSALRRLPPDTFKTASVGDSTESEFEKMFSGIAYTYVKDRAPRLLDYMVGFQLLERNEDKTRAVGVFGSNVEGMWLYSPVFFLAGDLKGGELLYMRDHDMFVPQKENWINDIIAKKVYRLGDPSDDPERGRLNAYAPDLRWIAQSPTDFKFSSERDAVGDLQKLSHEEPPARTDLRYVLAKRAYAVGRLAELRDRYPAIAAGLDRFYGPTLLSDAVEYHRKAASDRAVAAEFGDRLRNKSAFDSLLGDETLHPIKRGALMIRITRVSRFAPTILGDDYRMADDVEDAAGEREGDEIADTRREEEKTEVIGNERPIRSVQVRQIAYYRVVEERKRLSKLVILPNPIAFGGEMTKTILVRPSTGDIKICDPDDYRAIAVDGDSDTESCRDWLESLPKAGDFNFREQRSYIFLTDRQCTIPMKVRERRGKSMEMARCAELDEDRLRPEGRPGYSESDLFRRAGLKTERYEWSGRLTVGGPGEAISLVRGEIFVGKDVRVLAIADFSSDGSYGWNRNPSGPDGELYGLGGDPIRPASDRDTLLLQLNAKSPNDLRTRRVAGGFIIENERTGRKTLRRKKALHHLVMTHGLDKAAAAEILDSCTEKQSTHFLKYAYGFPIDPEMLADPGPPIPERRERTIAGLDGEYPLLEEQIDEQQVHPAGADPYAYDPYYKPNNNLVEVAQQAAQSEQKDVFDVAVLTSMLKPLAGDADDDTDLGDIMRGLDRLGRRLFRFYWHGERFVARYGKDDIKELENGLRNAFDTVGDVVLFLRKKRIESGAGDADDSFSPNDPDLGLAAID